MLSKEAIEEFKKIYKKEFREEISDEKALEKATRLLTLFNAVYRPIKKEWMEDCKIRKGKKDGIKQRKIQ